VSPELPHARQGEVGINRTLERLRALFNWGIERGHYHSENPFLKHGRPAIRMAKEVARTRRLNGDEEQRLLLHASDELKDLIIAALDTGMRRRELLSLKWSNVMVDAKDQPKAIMVSAESAKTNRPRTVPIMSARLRTVLLRRRLGPNGKKLPSSAHVFGNEVGEPVNNVKKAWRGACRRAKITGLNFHDLRRECGSRWLEGGVGLLTVSALLGHTQVTTTNTYLASSPAVAEDELRAFEAGRGNAFPNLSQTAPPDPSGLEKASEAVH
jgi:integrase